MTELDKNIINVTVYEIKNNIQLFAYTALWCGPCKKIKPKLIENMSKHQYKIISEETINKDDFKQNVNNFVPFFIVKDTEGSILDSIQTSDEIQFTLFLRKNKIIEEIVLDDDF